MICFLKKKKIFCKYKKLWERRIFVNISLSLWMVTVDGLKKEKCHSRLGMAVCTALTVIRCTFNKMQNVLIGTGGLICSIFPHNYPGTSG